MNITDIVSYFDKPHMSKYIYYLVILGTGLILLNLFSKSGFPLPHSLLYMFFWFLLILVFPVPEPAKSEVNPFNIL